MRHKLLLGIVSAATALSATLILVGCGGGGGPIKPPTTAPVETVNEQFLALLPDDQKGATYVGNATCLGCHTGKAAKGVRLASLSGRTRGRAGEPPPQIDLPAWNKTEHAILGVACEQCHGPGSKHAAAPGDTTILAVLSPKPDGTITSITDPIVCGQCHTPIYNDFTSSKHSELVVEQGAAGPAQNGSKTCLRCHNGQFRADLIDNTVDNASGGPAYQRIPQIEANIAALTTDQMADYGKAAKNSAGCADCHDPMRATGMKLVVGPDGKSRDLQLQRSTFNTDTSNYPAGNVGHLTTFNQSCGVCHAGGTSTGADGRDTKLQATTSRQSFHENCQYPMLVGAKDAGAENVTDSNGNPLNQPPAERNTAHAEAPDQCVHCHMPNGSHTWTVKLDVSCRPCHTADDAQARLAIQGLIQNGLAALRTRMSNWATANLGDPDMWEYTSHIQDLDKTPPTADQEKAIPIEIKRARHNYYFILIDHSYGVYNRIYTQYLLDIANRNLDRLGIPRSVPQQLTRAQVKAILDRDYQNARRAEASATRI